MSEENLPRPEGTTGAHAVGLTEEERLERERLERERLSTGETTGTTVHTHDTAATTVGRTDLSGEDLSRGPTPETRHPAGHVEGRDFAERDSRIGETGGYDDLNDTTQGPTPETRQVMRATDDDGAASGQPESDPRTRADVGGNQDTDLTKAVDPTRRDRDLDR